MGGNVCDLLGHPAAGKTERREKAMCSSQAGSFWWLYDFDRWESHMPVQQFTEATP